MSIIGPHNGGAAVALRPGGSRAGEGVALSTALANPTNFTNSIVPAQNDNDKMIYNEQGNLKEVGSIDFTDPKVWALLAEHKLDDGDEVPADTESQIIIGIKLFTNQAMIAAMTRIQVEAGVKDLEILTKKKDQQKWFANWYAKHINLGIATPSTNVPKR